MGDILHLVSLSQGLHTIILNNHSQVIMYHLSFTDVENVVEGCL